VTKNKSKGYDTHEPVVLEDASKESRIERWNGANRDQICRTGKTVDAPKEKYRELNKNTKLALTEDRNTKSLYSHWNNLSKQI